MSRHPLLSALVVAAGLASACSPQGEEPDATPPASTEVRAPAEAVRSLSGDPTLYFGQKAVDALGDDRTYLYKSLVEGSSTPVDLTVDAKTGAILSLQLSWTAGKPTPKENALAFVEAFQKLIDPRVDATEYRVGSSNVDCGNSVVTLDRFIGGKQVIGSRMTLHFDDAGQLVWVTNGVAPVPATQVSITDPLKQLPGTTELYKLMGKVPVQVARRVPVLVPMPDGSGFYSADLATWASGGRFRGAISIGQYATSLEIDASAQGAGRSSTTAPRVLAGEATNVPSQVSYRNIGGLRVTFLGGERNPLEAAWRFLEEHPTLFRTGAARCQFVPVRFHENPTVPGVYTARFEQRHGPLPVFGSQLIVRLEGMNVVQGATARTRGSISVAPTATVSAATAVDVMKGLLTSGVSADPGWKEAVEAALAEPARTKLVVMPAFLHSDPQKKEDRLAWKVDRGAFTTLVDATTKQPLWSTSSRHFASVVRDANGAGVLGYFGYALAEVDGFPQPGAPTPPNPDVDPARAGGNVSASLGRLQGILARNGWSGLNDRGGDLVVNTNVNLESGCPNAFFDFFVTNSSFFCLDLASADIVGHEMTHGVIAHSSGLFYADQSGAINEAYADLFGNFNDTVPGWLVGDDTPRILRDMLNPGTRGDPAHISGYVPRATTCGTWPWDCDFGNVHTNSGIINRAHAILADGLPGFVTGIGRERLERLAFFVMTEGLPSTATMNQVAGVTRDVCEMFVARGVTTPLSGLSFTMAHCDDVTNAFNQVGLNPGYTTGWSEPTLGFEGRDTFFRPGTDGSLPLTPGRCTVANISLQHRVPVLGTTLFADYDPATAMAARNTVLGWVETTAFDFTGVGATAAGPMPMGTITMLHSVRWTSAYGVKPTYLTQVQAPGTCAPPPEQQRTSNTFTEGFDTGVWTGSSVRTVGNPSPPSLPSGCVLDSGGTNIELVDGDGFTRIAGPGRNISHTVTHWFAFVPVNFTARASVASLPSGTNMSGNVNLSWELGRTVRVRWRYRFLPTSSGLECNPR
jgi:hypothetical protein